MGYFSIWIGLHSYKVCGCCNANVPCNINFKLARRKNILYNSYMRCKKFWSGNKCFVFFICNSNWRETLKGWCGVFYAPFFIQLLCSVRLFRMLSVFCFREYLKVMYIVQTTVEPPPRELHIVKIRNTIPKITDTLNGTHEPWTDVWLKWNEQFGITNIFIYLVISFFSLLFRVRSKSVMIWKGRKNSIQFEW